MARAHFRDYGFKLGAAGEWIMVPNATVTLYEAGTSTPLAQTIYQNRTGPTTLPNPFTSESNGTVEFWLDAAQDVRIVITGSLLGAATIDYVATVGDLSAALYQDMGGAASLAGYNGSSFALTVQNSDTTHGRAAVFRTPTGHGLFSMARVQANEGATTVDRVAIISEPTGVDELYPNGNMLLWVLHDEHRNGTGGNFVVNEVTLNMYGDEDGTGVPDSGAGKYTTIVYDDKNSMRALEAHLVRTLTATNWSDKGIEMSVQSQHPSLDPTTRVLLNMLSDNKLWEGAGASYAPISTVMYFSGGNGAEDYIRFYGGAAAGSALHFRVAGGLLAGDTAGDVIGGRLRPLTHASYDIGQLAEAWNNVFAARFQANDGNAANPTMIFQSSGTGFFHTSGGVGVSDGSLGSATQVASLTTTGITSENGLIWKKQTVLTGVISPAQLVANTDDWNPTGLATASLIRLSTDASRNLTGIVAQAAGTQLTLMNVGAQNLVLKNSVTSSAVNQFLLNADITLGANQSVTLWYDGTSSRWRVKDR